MRVLEGAAYLYLQTGLVTTHTVAIYNKADKTLEITEGYANLLPKILKKLRDFQREHNMTISLVKVEYW